MAIRFRNSSYSLAGDHKDRWVDVVRQNNGCLLWQSYESSRTLW